ncbi:hypothetical protein KC950_02585 [Candidatus Saccharibacteria bacterium]|nr:hypothetical protein [Candidatus Saccharibacteria bacterium]
MKNENPEILEQYFELLIERERLELAADEATEFVRPMVQDALDFANECIDELSNSKGLEDQLYQYGEVVSKTLVQLDELEQGSFITMAAPEVIKKRLEFLEDVRVKHVLEIASLATAETTEVVTEELGRSIEQTEDTEEREVEAYLPDIKITIRGDGVQIGERGKFVRLSGAKGRTQTDYSEQRLAVLRKLVKHAGNELRVQELWDMAFPDQAGDLDKKVMGQVKAWLDTLTFRRSPIVVHNGKHGVGSAYSIPNTNVELIESTTTKPAYKTDEATLVDEDFVVESNKSKQSGAANETEAFVDESVELEERAPVYFPLGRAESAILAEFLDLYKDKLEVFGLPTLPKETLDTLQANAKTTRTIQEFLAKFSNLIEARQAIVTTVNEYYEDDYKVLNDMVNMNIKDMRYGLFDYLTQFEADQREWIVNQLVYAEQIIEIHTSDGTFSHGLDVVGATVETVLPDGTKIVNGEIQEAEETPLTISFPDEDEDYTEDVNEYQAQQDEVVDMPEGSETIEENGEDSTVGLDTEKDVTDEEIAVDIAKEEKTEKSREPKWLAELKKDMLAVIADFDEQGVLEPGTISRRRLGRMTNSRSLGTEESARRALSNGLISKNQLDIDAEIDISSYVLMALQNNHQSAFQTKKRQKQVITLAEEMLNEHFASRQQ